MSIHCPYCQHVMELKGAKPGKYGPKCPACKGKFALIIPEGDGAPFVKEIPGQEPMAASIEDALGLPHAANPAPSQQPARQAASPARSAAQATVPPQSKATMPPQSVKATAPPRAVPAATAPPQHAAAVTAAPAIAPRTDVESPHSPPPPAPPMEEINLSGSLGGYEIKQKLGQGGMGAVFLARQVSLDRDVAIKVLSPRLAEDPQFISRFTREAYAAAQLTHHNVVQIHDIGVDKNVNYFSMEFVEGNTLAGVVKESGKLDPEVAVGYILQAARGLKFAHDHGMVHRDVKPDNLLLNDDGIVKVADLGLVKRAGATEEQSNGSPAGAEANAGVTQFNMSMGTPAYMPPEQATDAARVDQRADIYSLGCTFYDLLTGHPPYAGRTAVEVMTKHAHEAATPPDRVAKNVPAVISAVVMKMMAKRPEDRYQNLGEVTAALERFLGVDSGKAFTPKEEHAKVLSFAAERFNGSKYAKLRGWIIRGFFAATFGAAAICAIPKVGHPLIAGGLVGFAVLTTLIYQITVGISQRTFVFTKFRQLIFGASLFDWLKYLIVTAGAVAVLYAFNLHLVWLGFGVLAACTALAFHFTLDLLAAKERATPVHQVETMLKEMRLRGLDENALRQFVCRYADDPWEEFYEALFGYESKIQARRMWGKSDRGRDRKKHAAWRDAFIAWADHKQQLRKEGRERRILAKLEAKALQSKGVDQKLADKQAKKSAERMVDKAAVIKETAIQRAAVTAMPGASKAMPDLHVINPGYLDDDIEAPHEKEHKREGYLKRRYGGPFDMLFGKKVRFAAAAFILAGFAMWWNVNGGWEVKKNAADVMAEQVDPTELAAKKIIESAKAQTKTIELESKRKMEPLRLKAVPDKICDLVGSWNGGLAGVILVVSLLFVGKLLGLSVLLAAGIVLIGHTLKIPILHGQPWLAGVIGSGLAAFSIFFFRERKGF